MFGLAFRCRIAGVGCRLRALTGRQCLFHAQEGGRRRTVLVLAEINGLVRKGYPIPSASKRCLIRRLNARPTCHCLVLRVLMRPLITIAESPNWSRPNTSSGSRISDPTTGLRKQLFADLPDQGDLPGRHPRGRDTKIEYVNELARQVADRPRSS